jgi:hypothetical protein
MKLAFCFLSYEDIVHINVWKEFFQTAPVSSYSIFLHTKSELGRSELEGCIVIPTQTTEWGTFSLVEVQQALLTAAYKDTENYKFILLSGDAIPIYTFDTIYTRLTQDSLGWMNYTPGFHKENESTVSKKAWPTGKRWEWIFAQQWVVLNRTHVEHLFQEWPMIELVFSLSRFPDEHVYPIIFNAYDSLESFKNQSNIYVNQRNTLPCHLHHHTVPTTYHSKDFTVSELDRVYESGALFLRKICKTVRLTYDWNSATPLQATKRIVLSPRGFKMVPSI